MGQNSTLSYVVRCAIWYYLYNLKNVKNTHGGVLTLVQAATLLKSTLLHGCFSRFLNCPNGTKSVNAPHMSYDSIIDLSQEFIKLLGIYFSENKERKRDINFINDI